MFLDAYLSYIGYYHIICSDFLSSKIYWSVLFFKRGLKVPSKLWQESPRSVNQHLLCSLCSTTSCSTTPVRSIMEGILYIFNYIAGHSGFLEHWNSQKSLCNIWQRFSCLLDELITKKCKKKIFHGGLFSKSTLSVLRCTWTGRIIWNFFWDIILII